MPYSQKKAREISASVENVGVDLTAKSFGISRETVRRAVRMDKSSFGTSGIPIDRKQKPIKGLPRILIYDIETTPNLAYVWRCYKENITPEQIVDYGEVMCWAAKWFGNNSVMTDDSRKDKNDGRICRTLWNLFEVADIIVAHNGKAFDQATLNTRWVSEGLAPPPPTKVVDTLKIARAVFNFPINSLGGICKYLNIGTKLEHEGWTLWIKCMNGNQDAWERMIEYNIHDVLLLEAVYERFRPWDKRHPNLTLMYPDDGVLRCVCCGSSSLKSIPQPTYTVVNIYSSYRCMSCGKVMRSSRKEKRDTESLRHSL